MYVATSFGEDPWPHAHVATKTRTESAGGAAGSRWTTVACVTRHVTRTTHAWTRAGGATRAVRRCRRPLQRPTRMQPQHLHRRRRRHRRRRAPWSAPRTRRTAAGRGCATGMIADGRGCPCGRPRARAAPCGDRGPRVLCLPAVTCPPRRLESDRRAHASSSVPPWIASRRMTCALFRLRRPADGWAAGAFTSWLVTARCSSACLLPSREGYMGLA